jgi:hypothetical protein
MKIYKAAITEKLQMDVEAASRYEAERLVEKMLAKRGLLCSTPGFSGA